MTRETGRSADLRRRPINTWKAALFASVFAAATVLPLSAAGASSAGASAAPAGCSGTDLYVCATSVPRGDRARAPHQAVWGTTCTWAPPPSRGAECHRLI